MKDKISCRPDTLMLVGVVFHPIRMGRRKGEQGPAHRLLLPGLWHAARRLPPSGLLRRAVPEVSGQALGCGCFEVEDEDELDEDLDDEPRPPLTRVIRSSRYRPLCRAHRFRRHYLP